MNWRQFGAYTERIGIGSLAQSKVEDLVPVAGKVYFNKGKVQLLILWILIERGIRYRNICLISFVLVTCTAVPAFGLLTFKNKI